MKCPICGEHAVVMDTRAYGAGLIRRRKCKACGRLFYSEELPIEYTDGLDKMKEAQHDHYHRKIIKKKKD